MLHDMSTDVASGGGRGIAFVTTHFRHWIQSLMRPGDGTACDGGEHCVFGIMT
ncbi:MAG: hypothetical protein VSS75_000295 [Candidatus Parabeggiatoa sp.]|nr:hypothetical protein [Candidatus Parabeggiatoa sp.]